MVATSATDATFRDNGRKFIGNVHPDRLHRADPHTGITPDTGFVGNLKQGVVRWHTMVINAKVNN
jgi:hypothetical protein